MTEPQDPEQLTPEFMLEAAEAADPEYARAVLWTKRLAGLTAGPNPAITYPILTVDQLAPLVAAPLVAGEPQTTLADLKSYIPPFMLPVYNRGQFFARTLDLLRLAHKHGGPSLNYKWV